MAVRTSFPIINGMPTARWAVRRTLRGVALTCGLVPWIFPACGEISGPSSCSAFLVRAVGDDLKNPMCGRAWSIWIGTVRSGQGVIGGRDWPKARR
jgi:hypothetical protein